MPRPALLVLVLTACRGTEAVLQDGRAGWRRLPEAREEPPPYARWLRGVTVCVDPGHGGDARRGGNRGPSGVREAEVNLGVARALRGFLERSGARAVLTRDADEDLPLAERARVANRCGADFFLSIHHNAIDRRPEVNYTSVWYHAGVDHSPPSLDLARHVLEGLRETIRAEDALPCPLMSDFALHPGQGFGVLRALEVPGVLSEASFHTNPEEERRLALPEYQRREAWGHFLGIARYVAGGLPRAEPLAPGPGGELRFRLDDGLMGRGGWTADVRKVLAESVCAWTDGRAVEARYDPATGVLALPPLAPGAAVTVSFQNLFKHHNLRRRFVVGPDGARG
jgi:N-acetylmuramoyl-L-alanine amidase